MASTMKIAMEVKRRIATDSRATGRIWNLCLFSTLLTGFCNMKGT
jgi:hypothetical protein